MNHSSTLLKAGHIAAASLLVLGLTGAGAQATAQIDLQRDVPFSGALAPHRTLLIRAGRIVSIGSEAPPADATVIQGSAPVTAGKLTGPTISGCGEVGVALAGCLFGG
jgi:hypothetical protein